jgi:hypothetical protein
MADNKPEIDISPAFFAYGARCTMGFIEVNEINRSASLGSGTLIRFGRVRGILTCAHVLEANLAREESGVLLFPARADAVQMMRVGRIDLMDHVYFRGGPWDQNGPDLAFIRLPEIVMSSIEGMASVVDGEQQVAQILGELPEQSDVACLVFGVVQEHTGAPTAIHLNLSTTPFRALLTLGDIVNVRAERELDVFRFRPLPSDDLPTSFEGTSGGGLWQLYFRPDGALIQSRLGGVAFYQTEIDGRLQIIGHCQRSIYQALLREIKARWPD